MAEVVKPPMTAREEERRDGWVKAMADIAVMKEIQAQQAAHLIRMDLKLDLLWNSSQREQGVHEAEIRSNSRWRWVLSLAVSVIGTILAYRIASHP